MTWSDGCCYVLGWTATRLEKLTSLLERFDKETRLSTAARDRSTIVFSDRWLPFKHFKCRWYMKCVGSLPGRVFPFALCQFERAACFGLSVAEQLHAVYRALLQLIGAPNLMRSTA